MVFQCVAAALSLYLLSLPPAARGPGLIQATSIVVLLAVISTLYSGLGYVLSAAQLLRRGRVTS